MNSIVNALSAVRILSRPLSLEGRHIEAPSVRIFDTKGTVAARVIGLEISIVNIHERDEEDANWMDRVATIGSKRGDPLGSRDGTPKRRVPECALEPDDLPNL